MNLGAMRCAKVQGECLAKIGYDVTIFEALHERGGVLVYGIPKFMGIPGENSNGIFSAKEKRMEEKLKALIEAVPVIKNLIDGDFAISITDKSECIYSLDGKNVKPPLSFGPITDIQAKKGLEKAMEYKKVLNQVLTKEVEGKDLRLTIIPVYNDYNEIIGTFGIARSTENIASIQNASQELMSSLQETSSAVSEVANKSLNFSHQLSAVVDKTKLARESIKESSKTIDLIQNISKQSKLLGLNASIESARAGESGKGFAVVASEIRKLAEISGQSSERISKALMDMNNHIQDIVTSIQQLGDIALGQANQAEELAVTIDQITANSEVLVNNLNTHI